MAEVQVKDGDSGKKNKQKKQHLRVDFTPMVDMNMLLITFFMFCTTLLKPQTMNINMPSKDKTPDPTVARASTAVTLLLGENDELYYYLGMIDPANAQATYNDTTFLKRTDYTPDGLRKILLEKNKGTYELIQDLKVKLKNLQIKESQFNEQVKTIQENAMKVTKIAPTVMIKAAEKSTYKNLVDALDEMLVTNIGAYAIVDMDEGDHYLLFKKTNNPDYLTDKQKAEASNGK
jgi:biopolymer transport protein ExbD